MDRIPDDDPSRIIRLDQDDLSSEAAESLVRMSPGRIDREQIHILLNKNQDDKLMRSECDELESYLRICSLLNLLYAEAPRVITTRG